MNNEVKFIDKSSLKSDFEKNMRDGVRLTAPEMCGVVGTVLGGKSGKISSEKTFKAVMAAKMCADDSIVPGAKLMEYGSAFDVPQPCRAKDNKMMSVREMINQGVFMSSNSLIPDWQTLWDALRIDISVRKAAQGTVRESFYNIVNMPNSDKVFKPTEFFPYGIVFDENNGEGQSVTQGENLAGQVESIEHFIYAAGFTWTLLAELFDKSIDPTKITDAVMIGYNAKRDDLSVSPILDFSYSGDQQTAADTTSGAQRQELLYNTLENAIDDLGEREDPITDRKIVASDLRLLCSPLVARHVSRVIGGFTSQGVGGQNFPKNLPAISEISQVVAYDGETINQRAKSVVYSGCPDTKAYLVKTNRYMNVGVKRNLQVEVDMKPDVKTLSREERSWYFVEGQQTTGIQYFVQEITLPTW